MNNDSIKDLINGHKTLAQIAFHFFNWFPLNNSFGGITAKIGLSYLKGCKIHNQGKNNTLIIGDFSQLNNCTIQVRGNDNVIFIGDRCTCNDVIFWLEDDHNRIQLGEHTRLCGKIQFSAIEGTEIKVGSDCLFSSDIDIRTGDSHSLIQKGTANRINPSESISVGDHVWVGKGVTILKGTSIADNCMIGAVSLLCKKYSNANCVLAGVPAKEIKNNIDWITERI